MSMKKRSVLILGDFNNLLSDRSKLSKVIKNNKRKQTVDKPTSITPTSPTLLDLIITNNPNIVI